jgi:hypothetical protein
LSFVNINEHSDFYAQNSNLTNVKYTPYNACILAR